MEKRPWRVIATFCSHNNVLHNLLKPVISDYLNVHIKLYG